MNNPDSYQAWLAGRRNVTVSAEFPRGVMLQISRGEQPPRAAMPGHDRLQRWLEWVSLRPLAKAALLLAALILGAVRIFVTLQIILSS